MRLKTSKQLNDKNNITFFKLCNPDSVYLDDNSNIIVNDKSRRCLDFLALFMTNELAELTGWALHIEDSHEKEMNQSMMKIAWIFNIT